MAKRNDSVCEAVVLRNKMIKNVFLISKDFFPIFIRKHSSKWTTNKKLAV